MNLNLEYLVRSGLIKEFFQTPCSLFLEKEANKKVVVLAEKHRTKVAQHWNVFQCASDEALPPMNEYEVDTFFDNPMVIPRGYRPLEYACQSIPSRLNSWSHPMEQEMYDLCHNSLLNSWAHIVERRDWLWNAFLEVYEIEVTYYHSWHNLNRIARTFQEQEQVRQCYPRKWKYWQMWLKHLMSFTETAPELVFTSCT